MSDEENRGMIKQKEIEFYSGAVAAWFNTRLEHDKSLLSLSAGGIGLLLTLLTTMGVSTAEGLVLYLLSMFSFLLCLGVILVIFKKNGDHIEASLKVDGHLIDPLLATLDNVAIAAFAAGILFSTMIGASAAINSYSSKEKAMANESKQKITGVSVADSVNGFSSLKPNGELNKSFNGMNSLQPATPQNSIPVASQVSTPATSQATNKK